MAEEKYYFKTKDFAVGYEGKSVVSDINIGIRKGEILTLIGPNGSGKSTFLKSIIRQLDPVAGVCVLDDKALMEMDKKQLAKNMSIVLTARIQTELMSVRDVVESGRHPYTGYFGRLDEHDREVVEESIRLIGIEELADKDFMKISDGQRQRVMLARAIAQEPEVIVLDEPTSFLDIRYKLEFLSTLYKLSREKKLTVIMSLHEVELARNISDKVLCFKNGAIDRFGDAKEVMSEEYIFQLFDIDKKNINMTLLQ